jgi:FAD/FMN-containing dehydrogenase
LGVVVPESTDDVVALARYAAERRVPLHARGAGTGLAGESLGPGLVIDFSKHMRRVLEIGPDFVTVQAGASLDIVNRRLAPLGRMIGPDPGGSSVCTIGGMVGGNAAGARSLHYGTTADHVIGMNVVMADGESLRAEKALWPLTEDGETDARGRLVERVASLYQYYADAIAKHRPRTPRNRCGYALDGVLQADGVDLGRVIVGSEGTLALVTEVTMRTVPVPTAQAAVFVPFARLSDALAAIPDCLRDHPSACELVDWRSLSLARDAFSEIINPLPDEAESALVIEFLGDDGATSNAASRHWRPV